MKTGEALLLDLIGMIYETVEDTNGWPRFLAALKEGTGGSASAIFIHDSKTLDGNGVWAVQVAPEYLRLYDEYYHSKNIWVLNSRNLMTPGRVVTSHEVCPDSKVLRSEYYADFLRPQNIFHNIGATLLCEGSTAALMTVLRPYREGHFEREQVGLVKVLMPHLQRALQIQNRLRLSGLRFAASSEALDRIRVGIFVIDSSGFSEPLNTAAQTILSEGDLHLACGSLAASKANEHRTLRSLITDALASTDTAWQPRGGMMHITRKSLQHPLEVLVTPICCGYGILGESRKGALVLVVDPEREAGISEDLLRRTWHLSRAEAKVATLLSSGKDIQEIADELGISLNTARSHLKRVLSKTGSRRQAEVVLRCLQSCAVLQK